MNKKKFLIRAGMLMLAIPIVMLSCQKMDNKQQTTPKTDNTQLSEKMAVYQSMGIVPLKSVTADLIYSAALCAESDIYASVPAFSISYPATWAIYKFYGVAGQAVDISLVRVTCEMDPAWTLFFGTSATTDGIAYYAYGNTNPDLQWLLFRDDDLTPPCENCFAYWDPTPGYTLPYTGWYTLGVFDYISCGGVNSLEYHLTINGIADCHIVIDGCDTYVNNQVIDGYFMQSIIEQCAIGAKNHGKYVSCVAHTCEGWVELGLITQSDQDAILACAAQSGIPYPE